MGGSESKTADVKHELLFDEEEKRKVSSVFASISHGTKTFNKEQFQHFTNSVLDPFTSSRLYDLIEGPLPQQRTREQQPPWHHVHNHQGQGHEIKLQHFASHLGILLKGNVNDLTNICIFLSSTTPHTVSSSDLVKLVTNILHSYEKVLNAHCYAYQSWMFASSKVSHDRLANSLLLDLMDPGSSKASCEGDVSAKVFDESAIEQWLSRCSFFSNILNHVFYGAFQFQLGDPKENEFEPRVPHVRDTNWSRCRTMLDFPTVLYLNHSLSSQLQTQWKMIFSSALHGASFSQLLQCIRNKGPTFVVIRDKSGHVFGGFAAVSWEINPKFTGNSSCFLFRVGPEFSIHLPTGYNNNFMYLNHHVQTLPNGLGMGGQLEYFGLWIDQEFDRGHSKAGTKGCTTYGSPQLSGETEFQVDSLEVWAVGKTKQKDDDELDEDEEDHFDSKRNKKTILDKVEDADKAILDMIDRGTRSDALRDEPLVEETAAHKTIISPF